MADYFTQFSCLFDVGSAANIERALEMRAELAAEIDAEEGTDIGFEAECDPDSGEASLWISSDCYGEPDHVIRFVLACAEAFDLQGRWGFTWSLSCSKPRLDAFGGGAQLIDLSSRRSIGWVDCADWLGAGLVDEPHESPPAADAGDLHPQMVLQHAQAGEERRRRQGEPGALGARLILKEMHHDPVDPAQQARPLETQCPPPE